MRFLSLFRSAVLAALLSWQAPGAPGGVIVNAPPPTGGNPGAISVATTVQEALYTGVGGFARTNEPITVGLPLPDDATQGATDISQLSLSGASVGQFRVLGRWPSNRIKWVLVDTQLPSLTAGGSGTFTLTGGATGNFGGSLLAVDQGATIAVDTGTAQFSIRKANFNGFDSVVVGGVTVVQTGASEGLVIMGGAYPATTCTVGNCTTPYTSDNDSASTCSIEENGPVRAVVKCTGAYKNSSGNSYMDFLVRMHFYKNKSYSKSVVTTKNARYGTSGQATTAYQAIGASEWRVTPTLGGVPTYQLPTHNTTLTGTLGGAEDIYLYQGQSTWLQDETIFGVSPLPTNDTGYTVVKGGLTQTTGTSSQVPTGWADIRSATGTGVQIGIYQMAANWPKSLEINQGGADVRIGLHPRQNSRVYHQQWPTWSSFDVFFNFHSTALSDPAGDFLKFQHYLLGRAPIAHYNTANVFMWPIVDPTAEQAYYQQAQQIAVPALQPSSSWPIVDRAPATGPALDVTRFWSWSAGGGENQMELRWSDLMLFLRRGHTGRYLNSAHFYRMQTDYIVWHSEGFDWHDTTANVDYDVGNGKPLADSSSPNFAQGVQNWLEYDGEHNHIYGMGDFYFMSGDELVKDAYLDGQMDMLLTPTTYFTDLALLGFPRVIGARIMQDVRMYEFLTTIGGHSADATTILNFAKHLYEQQVNDTTPCPESNRPYTGCSQFQPGIDGVYDGHDDLRGFAFTSASNFEWCDATQIRSHSILQHGILVASLLELRKTAGTGWVYYDEALDISYGMARASFSETWFENGTGRWDQEGPRAAALLDSASKCPPPMPDDDDYEVRARTTIWSLFYAMYLMEGRTDTWEPKFQRALQRVASELNTNWGEFGSYWVGNVIHALDEPTQYRLQDITLNQFTNNGGGSYTLGWIVPFGAQSYRIKYSTKQIVDWLGFNAHDYLWIGDPTNTRPFYSATPIDAPAPLTPGQQQTINVSGLPTNLVQANFKVKVYAPTTQTPTGITWTLQTNPPSAPVPVYWNSGVHDPLSGRLLYYSNPVGSANIYVTAFHAYNTGANTWQFLGGEAASIGNECNPAEASPQPWPVHRHALQQYAVDTSRNRLWLMGGVCANQEAHDFWYYTLNANPTANTWTNVNAYGSLPSIPNLWSHLVYVPSIDALVMMGANGLGNWSTWVYCPGSGSPTSAQAAIGCSSLGTWIQAQSGSPAPPESKGYINVAYYDSNLGKILFFMNTEANGVRAVWEYNLQSKVWANKNATAIPVDAAPNSASRKDHVLITSGPFAGTYVMVRLSNNMTTHTGTQVYNPATNAYTALTVTGGVGPKFAVQLAWDPVNNKIVSFGGDGGTLQIYHGVLQ